MILVISDLIRNPDNFPRTERVFVLLSYNLFRDVADNRHAFYEIKSASE